MWKLFYDIESKYLSNFFSPNITYMIAIFVIMPFFEKIGLEKGVITQGDTFPVVEIFFIALIFFVVCRLSFYCISWKKFKDLAVKENKANSIAFYFYMQYEYIKSGIVKKILCFAVGLYILNICFACIPSLMNKSANNLIVLAIPPLLVYMVFALFETIKPCISELTALFKLITKKPENINLTGAALFLYQGISTNSEIYQKERGELEQLFEKVKKNVIREEKTVLEKTITGNLPKKINRRL